MAMRDWYPVPIAEMSDPTNEYIEANGLMVGSLSNTRQNWLMASNTISFAKVCYRYIESGGNYDTVIAIRNTESGSEHRLFFEAPSTYIQTNPLIAFVYGNIYYYSYGGQGGVKPEYRNPLIPSYASLEDALIALDDGIWEWNDDPYYPGGESGTGGGTGDFDEQSDPVTIPALPQVSAVNTGFITIFNPTISEMLSLSTYMWSNPLFDVSAWKKIFADPMQAILGLSIVPVAVPDGGRKIVTVGNIPTGIEMTTAASQYVVVDCGSLNVNEFWGAYLDYDPYTKAEIYLPYIGTHALAVDDIMGKTVSVVYHIDILSGACCAYVKCGDSVLYSFAGQCASSIPITGDNWTNVINGAISIAGSIGSMVASGGMSAPMAIGQIASTAVNTMKPSIEKSGSMGGTSGFLGVQTPYLILTRPRQALPKDQNVFKGYPSFITATMGDLSGYTEIDTVHLEDIPATDAEIVEIESILKTGVIF